MANETFRCKVCGGQAEWDPTIQKVKCKFCDTIFELSDFANDAIETGFDAGTSAVEQGYSEANDESGAVRPEDLRIYKCQHCGAEIITDKTTMATHCVFCNNPVILQEQLATEFKPKWIIPFKIPREQVEDIYLKYIKKPFTPDAFLSTEHIKQIKGVYVPFWLFNIETTGDMSTTGDRVRSWSDSHYNYTEHNYYNIRRAGHFRFKRIPVDASSKTPNDAMDSIEPFDFNDIKPFDLPYLSGFLAERYDETQDDCISRAEVRAKQTTVDLLRQTIDSYSTLSDQHEDANILNVEAEYTMLPTYLLFTEYNGETYVFAVNGQTGKAVGSVPIDTKKKSRFFWKNFLIPFSLISIIGILLSALGIIF